MVVEVCVLFEWAGRCWMERGKIKNGSTDWRMRGLMRQSIQHGVTMLVEGSERPTINFQFGILHPVWCGSAT